MSLLTSSCKCLHEGHTEKMDEATALLDKEVQCGYCHHYFDERRDWRVLPCSHIHCKNCVSPNPPSMKQPPPFCPYCKKIFKGVIVDQLPKARRPDPLYVSDEEEVLPMCYSGICRSTTDIKFCAECDIKMCQIHEQHHNELFGWSHKPVPVIEYQNSPASYHQIRYCRYHKKERLIQACGHCYKEACKECVSAECSGCSDKYLNTANKLPSSITLSSTLDVKDKCRFVSHRSNGDIFIVDGNGGLNILSKMTGRLTKLRLPFEQVCAIIERPQAVYILHLTDRAWKVKECSFDLRHFKTLFKFKNYGSCPAMTVSETQIVAWNFKERDGQSYLVFYNMLTKKRSKKSITGFIHPHLLPDNKLLLASDDVLTRVLMKPLTEEWTCQNLFDIDKLFTNNNRDIYASTSYLHSIYIISSDGKNWIEMHNDNLPAVSGQFSVKEDELVVPDLNSTKVYIFKLNYY